LRKTQFVSAENWEKSQKILIIASTPGQLKQQKTFENYCYCAATVSQSGVPHLHDVRIRVPLDQTDGGADGQRSKWIRISLNRLDRHRRNFPRCPDQITHLWVNLLRIVFYGMFYHTLVIFLKINQMSILSTRT
jgi:hypothetical protein